MPTKQKIARPNRSREGPQRPRQKEEKKPVLAEMPDGCGRWCLSELLCTRTIEGEENELLDASQDKRG